MIIYFMLLLEVFFLYLYVVVFYLAAILFNIKLETIAAWYTKESVEEMMRVDANPDVYKEKIVEVRKRAKRDIYAWSESFVHEHKRDPNKTERNDIAGYMFSAYSSVSVIFSATFILHRIIYFLFFFF